MRRRSRATSCGSRSAGRESRRRTRADREDLQQPLPGRRRPRDRRDGACVLRDRHAPAAARRDQGSARPVRRGRRLRQALLVRGAVGGEALASEHRQRLRLRPRERRVLHRHGARRRRDARRADARRARAARADRRRLRDPDRQRARVRAPARAAAPGHQAGEHPGHQGRRRQAERLRDRARRLRAHARGDAAGDGDGQRRLHLAGAGAGPRDRRAQRPVRGRRRPLSDAHRRAAVHRRHAGRGRAQARLRAGAGDRHEGDRDQPGRRGDRRSAAAQGPGRAVLLGDRARERAARRARASARRPRRLRRRAAPDLAAAGVAESSHPEHRGVDPRWIVMPLLLVLAIAIGFFALRGAPVFPPPNAIAVPDFTNVSGSVAAQRLEALGLRAQPTEEPSETIRQGYVVRQDPAPGAKLAKDAAVALVISAGLPRVQIPDVKGYSAPDAQRALQAAKLKSKIAAQTYSATVPAGQVLDVSPAVGSSVRENSVVALTVSKGVHPVSVPSIVSLKVAEARRRLAALGLTLTVGQQTESEAVPQDEIASQDPAAGTSVDPKSAVTVIVSTGPPAATVPNVVGADPDQAQQTLRSAGFVPTVTYNVDATNATQKVSAQRPDAGTSAKKSSSVTIFVSVPGTVPDVTGMTLDEAKKTLVAAGYQIGSTAYTADETAPGGSVQDGQVVRTEPEAGKPLTPGESVNITVMRSGASNGAPGGDGDGGRR